MTAAMHRRPNQRRDDLSARLRSAAVAARDTWTRAVRLIPAIPMISRRVRVAGGAPAATPVAGAPEVPAPATCPPGGAGTSPELPDAAPGEVTAPATPGAAARPPWATWQDPPGTPMRNAGRGAAGRRETIAMPALDAPVRPYLLAHLARQDGAVTL